MKSKKISSKILLLTACFIFFQLVNLFSFANTIDIPKSQDEQLENKGVITEIVVDKDGVDAEAVFKITNVATQEFVEKTELDSKITDIDVVEGNTYLLELKENDAFEPYSVQFFVGADDNGVFKAFLEDESELDSIVLQKATPNDGVINELSVDKDGVDAEAVFKIINVATQEFVEKTELNSKITDIDVVEGNTYLLELKENEAFEPYSVQFFVGVEFSVTVGDDNTFYALLENNTTLDTIQLEKKRLESGWREVDDKWYYIDENGENLVGWYFDNTYHGMYYLDADGVMVTGWHQIEGVWYRFAKSGKMATGWVDDEDYNSWYHFDENGEMTTGWIYDEDYASWYYLHDNGKMAIGWVDDEDYNSWYHFDEDGKMTTGWIYDESYSSWYYLHDDGKMATGWVDDEDYNSWYHCGENGKMTTGWIYDEDYASWYYLHDNGKMAIGWVDDEDYDSWYYFNNNGKMAIGWIYDTDDNYKGWYYLNKNGKMKTGWFYDENYKSIYYLDDSGKLIFSKSSPYKHNQPLNTPGLYNVNGFIDASTIKNPHIIESVSKESLINKYNQLPQNHCPNDLTWIDSNMDNSVYLTREAATAYTEMQKAARKKGYEFMVYSGYRSCYTQEIIYYSSYANDPLDAIQSVAYPGASEHNAGLAIDIWFPGGDADNYYYMPEGLFLKHNAYKYGFILRYPEDKEDITNYMYEPWHYRYVGKRLAKELYNKNLTLEEFYGTNELE